MNHDTDHERLVAELEEAGLVTRTDDGVALTGKGAALGRTLAMTADEDERDQLMELLLG